MLLLILMYKKTAFKIFFIDYVSLLIHFLILYNLTNANTMDPFWSIHYIRTYRFLQLSILIIQKLAVG
ncbi:hypothetical protein IO98_22870 [Lacrimispora celerecrescens]|uniref:Uncharacterized protein n=1 Tax=Lacrimispora celerecrescens TaxID=29354 RepID=A0A084JC17_9FIRM|nr:hypothetical protein IO98_22870 [Lacrimispora celerecrescens]